MNHPAPLHHRFGRYELLTLLARGGMAEVYLARMTGVGGFARLLVIKRILPHLTDDPDFVEMFLNEGRIAARLTHPNVCQVHELGEVDGHLFLAMEYLEGLSWAELSPRIPLDGHFELRCTAAVLGQVCDGLGYAHELRDLDGTATPVVHRDVSPQNLLVTSDGISKLLDFGVSKVLTEGSRTRTGMLKGKLPYMAPEQIRGEPVDPRADVFSMGTVLWESLTGERLFRRDSDYQIWRAVTEEDIPSVTSRRPTLPKRIDAVVERALERDPDRRYPTIRAFASDLREVADALGGPLDQAALAEVVRTLGASTLLARAHQVSHALGRPLKDVRTPPAPAVTEAPATAAVANDTRSVKLRDQSVRLAHRRWSWWLIAVAALALIGGIVTALGTTDPEPAKVATAGSPRDAAWPSAGDAAGIARHAADHDAGSATLLAAGDGVAGTGEAASDAGIGDTAGELEPVAEDAGTKRPVRRRTANPGPVKPVAAKPGQYSVDSRPYATIFIDGTSYGETPLFKILLAPGKHRIRAVRADGKVQRFAITIEPGKLISSGTLAW